MNDKSGNFYRLTQIDSGDYTFEHLQTGELLHSHIGPFQEAWSLYVEGAGLPTASGEVTVYDAGMGCASQLIALRTCFQRNTKLDLVRVVSFDLEKLGLNALLENIDKFDFAKPHEEFLKKCLEIDFVTECDERGRRFEWSFQRGDFCKTIQDKNLPPADVVFYDFFSPVSHPELWCLETTKNLFERTSENAILLTYSSATAIRASLLGAGFFVGLGKKTGTKRFTTFASRKLESVETPLTHEWVKTFERSHLPFLNCETPQGREAIVANIKTHAQFKS